MEFNVADLYEAAADRVPEREVLVCGEKRATFAGLDQRANRLAHFFRARGIGAGERIGIYAHNAMEWVEAMLAAFKIRAIPININYRYVEDELRYLFGNADLSALVYQRRFAPRLAAIRGDFPELRHYVAFDEGDASGDRALDAVDFEEAMAAGSPERDFEPRSGDDTYMLYTGGTTGMPKGVLWHQREVIFALGGGIDPMTRQPAERPEEMIAKINPDAYLTQSPVAPLMHGAAQWAVLGQVFIGNRVVLYPGPFDPYEVWATVEREKVNALTITGDAIGRPLVEALQEKSYDLSSLIVLSSSAAILSRSVKRQLLDLLPNLMLIDAVGASEQGMTGLTIVTRESLDQPQAEGTGLKITPGPQVTVLDDDLRPVEPGSGVVGRLARGGYIPYGYYKDPEKTAAVFVEVDGKRWSIAGDLATVDADGSIVLYGRGSTCINSGGEKIYPEEVESALKSHDAVFDALVVGVPDERWGERVAAVVETRPGCTVTLGELDAHCRGHIAGYKVPRELHVVERVRRSPSGKPDYPWARAVAGAEG